jgi:hypothetical protein
MEGDKPVTGLEGKPASSAVHMLGCTASILFPPPRCRGNNHAQQPDVKAGSGGYHVFDEVIRAQVGPSLVCRPDGHDLKGIEHFA